MAYQHDMREYLYGGKNYVSQVGLNKWMPSEVFWKKIPEISMTQFKFLELVYYQNWNNKSGKVVTHCGRFLIFSGNVGDTMTFKILWYSSIRRIHYQVLYRQGVP